MPINTILHLVNIISIIIQQACPSDILTVLNRASTVVVVQNVKNFTISRLAMCHFVKTHVTHEKDLALLHLFGLRNYSCWPLMWGIPT